MPRGRPPSSAGRNNNLLKNETEPGVEANPLRIRLNLKALAKRTGDVEQGNLNDTEDNNKENRRGGNMALKSPKITLSVRRIPDKEKSTTDETNFAINSHTHSHTPVAANSFQKVSRPRGRPPKYPRPPNMIPGGDTGSGKVNRIASFSRNGLATESSRLASLSPSSSFKNPFPPNSAFHLPPLTHSSSISLREQERFKHLQNLLPQHLAADYERLIRVDYQHPFDSVQDAYERLLPFHILSHAACPIPAIERPACDLDALRIRYAGYCRAERETRVPIEIQLLENRLNLEEERFLLQKLKADCMNKYDKIPQ